MSAAWVAGQRARLLELLTTLAYEDREVTLASGQKSRFYIDCKQVALSGEGHFLLGRLFLSLLDDIEGRERASAATPQDVFLHQACGGMSIGADPLSSALSLTAFLGGRELPAVYVRKESKGHGTGAYLEGLKAVPANARVVLVEDVVTTGGSSLLAVERLRAHGFSVAHVLAIVDRQAGGREAFAKEGLELHALFTRADFPATGP